MARIKIRDGGDKDRVLDYIAPIVSVQAVYASTVTSVVLATIAATDIVLCQLLSNSSVAAFISQVVITAGTGFAVTTQGASDATLVYAVFHPNA
jgi:hypothetical protein